MRHRKCLPLFSCLFHAIFMPFITPLPASFVNRDPEPLPLRNGPTYGSDFARVAAKAETDAAAGQGKINVVDPIRRSAQPDRADSLVEVDASMGALVPEVNRALKVAGEQVSLMVAGTVDGQVHALDADTGELRWSFSTGDPLVKSYQQLPGTLDEKLWLIPTLDGSILVKTAQGLGRPDLNVRHLVDQTPFLAQGGTFFTGSKVSRIFGVDARTGEVRQVLSGDTADSLASDRKLLARSGSDDDVIWIGRTDYTVRAFDVPTGQEQWNLTVGEFMSLDNLKIAAGSNGVGGRDGNGGGSKGGISPAAGSRAVASSDGSLRLKALPRRAGKTKPHVNLDAKNEWKTRLPAHVASVFRVVLEEASDHTYLPMQSIRLVQSAGDEWPGGSSGSGGVASVGLLDNAQLYAVILDEEDDEEENVGEHVNANPVGTRASKKNRHGEGKGGRTTATQSLIPHPWDGPDLGPGGGLGVGGHEIPGMLVPSLLTKGSPRGSSSYQAPRGLPRSCQPGHPSFPQCLVGVHPVQPIGAGANRGVKVGTGYLPRLPPPSFGPDMPPDRLVSFPAPRPHLHALLRWLHRGWSIVSLGILAVVVMVIVDSRRAAKLFRHVGLRGYPLYAKDGAGSGGEYDPTADSGFSGASEASASIAGGGGKEAVAIASGVKSELRVGCLTVSDKVLGYGSHGTVVYRGLLEGRPVAVKRMLTDFHARADREISLLIESDGHPNVVRYFVRELSGEFVYLALQLCQLSLHNAMAQIHSAMAQARKRSEQETGEKAPAPRIGLCRALTREDITAPPELRAALLQVSQGVEHLHSLRIVHRDLKPHNILLAAKERKGQGLGRKMGDSATEAGDGGGAGDEVGGIREGEDRPEALQKLSSMRDVARFVLKISDMGLGKKLLNGQSSFGMSSYGRMPGGRDHAQGGDALPRAKASNGQSSSSAGGHVGSIGWQAPEVIADRVRLESGQAPPAASGDETAFPSIDSSSEPSWAMEAAGGQNSSASTSTSSRRTQAVDVFSLGCVFHHCIVPGSHPFGNWYEREANIIQNNASHLEELAHIPDANDLVSLMTAREPDARPSAAEVCKHPFFWNKERRLSFLLEFSDRLEQDTAQSPLLVIVEAGAASVVGRSWDIRLDPELTEDAGRYRKYDFSSVRDLLRVVRNKRHHFHELPERVKGLMSPLPGGFLRYVEGRFPQLLMHCVKVTGALLIDERLFKEYLVPFRRTIVPNGVTAPRAQQAVVAETAAAAMGTGTLSTQAEALSTSDGQSKDVSRTPLPSLERSPGSKSDAPASRTPLPASELPSLSPEEHGAAGADTEGGALPESSSVQDGKTSEGGEAGVGVRSKEAGEGWLSGGSSDVGVGLLLPVSKSSASVPPGADRKPHAGGGVEGTVTEQNGPRGEGALRDVLLWNKSAVAKSMGCRGWWRHQDHWQRRLDVAKQRPRAAHLNKALQDPKYRTRLCSHWENSKGTLCPMRRRGASKCDFAHGGIELRVRANKRDRWGRHTGANGDGGVSLDTSGGEDTLGVARSIGRIRVEHGEKDGAGSSLIHGARGGGGGGGAAGTAGGVPRQSKRSKSGGTQGGEVSPGGGDSRGYQGRSHDGGGGRLGDHLQNDLDVAGPHQRIGNGGGRSQSRSPRGRRAELVGSTPPTGPGIIVSEDATARQAS